MAPAEERFPEGVLEVRQIGFTRFRDALALQHELVERRLAGDVGDVLVLTEHEPVVTVGRAGPDDAPAAAGADEPETVRVDRTGGRAWHGPGQLVAYPILRLEGGRRDLHRYVRDLEEVVLRCLAEVDVRGTRRPGRPGVWIGERRVAAVGVAARRWVTSHGFAIDLRVDPSGRDAVRPCGLRPDELTSLSEHAELPPGSLLFQVLVVKHLCEVLDLELPPIPPVSSPGGGHGGGPGGPPGGGGGFPTLPILPS